MTDPREPIRLIANAGADPLLRDALRVIHADAPSAAALTALAERAERAVREGSAAVDSPTQGAGAHASAHAYSLATKLVIAGVVASALVYAGVQRARVEQRALPKTPVATDAHARVPAHAQRSSTAVAVRAAGAPAPAQGAVDEQPTTRAPAIDLHAARAKDAQRSKAIPAKGQPRQAAHRSPASTSSAQHPADTSPRRSQAAQAARDTRDEARGPAAAASEIALLESAQHALLREPRRALELLDQHRSSFARGAFAQERDVLILEAFQRLHDTAALREGARAFMQRYPRSPHRARVEKLIEDLR